MSSLLPCGRPKPTQHSLKPELKDQLVTRLETYIEKNGLRRSDQRLVLLEEIFNAGGHLTAQELVQRVASVGLGPATVYRGLALLVDAGILVETQLKEKDALLYEIDDGEHHDHVICVECGQIFEFHSEEIENTQKKVLEKMGFSPAHHKHVLFAHCSQLEK